MKTPEALESLIDHGVITEVVRPLLAGKEAQIYLVLAGGEQRVAKVYKAASQRSFKQRVEYTEGRQTRNTRDQRAMKRRSKYGRAQDEAAWRSAEVDAIYRLQSAGVRVPEPFAFVDGVLVMELVTDSHGQPAPRLSDVHLEPKQAREVFDVLLRETVKMLAAGIVHGDLSGYNVLIGKQGPVIIDFPQCVDPTKNQNARKILLRDVRNLTDFLYRTTRTKHRPFGEEMWDLYERNLLTADTELTGVFVPTRTKPVQTMSLLDEIDAVMRESRERRRALGLPEMPPARRPRPAPVEPPANNGAKPQASANRDDDRQPRRRRRRRRRGSPQAHAAPTSGGSAGPSPRRDRGPGPGGHGNPHRR